MEIVFASQYITSKLAARGITIEDIGACFRNKHGGYLQETRPQHETNPPTLWFIAKDGNRRLLKVVFIYFSELKEIHIKSAFEPNESQIALYEKFK